MRRAILAVIAGSTLLAGSACDSDANTSGLGASSAPPAGVETSSAPPPDYSANTQLVCAKLQSLYATQARAFGAAMGKMLTYREAKQTGEANKAEKAAAGQLLAAARKIRQETAAAEDPDFQAAAKVSAAKLEASAKDHKYLDKVKTLKDLNGTVQSQFAEWLTPVSGFCT